MSTKQTCDVCDGSGQRPHFKGVSRFVLSWEDCPTCSGMGYLIVPDDAPEPEKAPPPATGANEESG